MKPLGSTNNVVFLSDVDNTLRDNDAVGEYLRHHLATAIGKRGRDQYFAILEALREESRAVPSPHQVSRSW